MHLPKSKASSMHNEKIWQAFLPSSILLVLGQEVLSFNCAAYFLQMDQYKIRSFHLILFKVLNIKISLVFLDKI